MLKLFFFLCVYIVPCLFLSGGNALSETPNGEINKTTKNPIDINTGEYEQRKSDSKLYCFTPDCHVDFNEGIYEIYLEYMLSEKSKDSDSYKRLSLKALFSVDNNKRRLTSLFLFNGNKWRELNAAHELSEIREVLAAASNSQDFLCYRMVKYYLVNKMREHYFDSYQKALKGVSDTGKQSLSVEKQLYFDAQSELIDNFSLFCGLKDNKTNLDNLQEIASSISDLLNNLTYMDILQLNSNKTDDEMLPKKTKIYNDSIYKSEPFDESYCFTPEFRSVYEKGACEVHLKFFVMDSDVSYRKLFYSDQLSVKTVFEDIAGERRLCELMILDGNKWRKLNSVVEFCKVRDVLTVANRSQCYICYNFAPNYFSDDLNEFVDRNIANASCAGDIDLSPERKLYFSAQKEFASSFCHSFAFKWHKKDLLRLKKVTNCMCVLLEGKTYKDIK